jgi:hypothetical protein
MLPNSGGYTTGARGVTPLGGSELDVSPAVAMLKKMMDMKIVPAEKVLDELFIQPRERKAKAAQLDLQAQQSKDQLALQPDVTAAQRAGLKRTIEVTPLQTTAEIGDLNNHIALQPGALDIAKKKVALEGTGLDAQQPGAEFLADEAKQDPSGGRTKSRLLYESMFGAPVKKDDGTVDYDSMDELNQKIGAAKLRALMMQANSPLAKELFDELGKRNRFDLAFNPDGTFRSPADVAKDLKTVPTLLTPEQSRKAAQDYGILNTGLQKLQELRELINDPSHEVVGPRMGQGDIIGTNFARMQAWLGGDQSKLASQQKVRQAIAQQLGDMMKSFSNIRNVQEFKTLGGRIPDLTNPKENWNQYLDEAMKLTHSTMDTIKSELPQGVSVPEPVAPKTANATPPAEDISKLPLVNSQADYNALQSGTRFRNARGDVGVKP